MLFPDADPNDIFNPQLRREGLLAEENGHGIAVWHGTDEFTREDVEILLNLDTKTGGLAMGGRVWAAHIMEKGHLLILSFVDKAKGHAEFDIESETMPMNLERTGIEVFNDGVEAHLRLFDKLTGDNLLQVDGDQLHELVDTKLIDPRDYHGSAFRYAVAGV